MGKKIKIQCGVCSTPVKLRHARRTCPNCHTEIAGSAEHKEAVTQEEKLTGKKRRREELAEEQPKEQKAAPVPPAASLPKAQKPPRPESQKPKKVRPTKANVKTAHEWQNFRHFRLAKKQTLVDNVKLLPEVAAALRKHRVLAVDCEGVRLSRTGALTLVQVATTDRVYLIDVAVLGLAAFASSGLKSALEDPAVNKLMFDCRRDSDALFHQFGVKLAGVTDVQLMAVAARRARGARTTTLPGLASAAKEFISKAVGVAAFALKHRMKERFSGEEEADLWARRPMEPDALMYAAVDAALLIQLHDRLSALLASLDNAAAAAPEAAAGAAAGAAVGAATRAAAGAAAGAGGTEAGGAGEEGGAVKELVAGDGSAEVGGSTATGKRKREPERKARREGESGWGLASSGLSIAARVAAASAVRVAEWRDLTEEIGQGLHLEHRVAPEF